MSFNDGKLTLAQDDDRDEPACWWSSRWCVHLYHKPMRV